MRVQTEQTDHWADLAELRTLVVAQLQAEPKAPYLGDEAWLNLRGWIANKFVMHLLSIEQLASGIEVDVRGAKTVAFDFGSLAALVRVAVENLIVFGHIFGVEDREQSLFRALSWQLAGLIERRDRVSITEYGHSSRLQTDKERLVVELRVRAHPTFQGMKPRDQKKFLSGDWRMSRGWVLLATGMGLNGSYFTQMYDWLSSLSHTSFDGALQVNTATQLDARAMTRRMLGVVCVVAAHFQRLYAFAAPPQRAVLAASPSKAVHERWCFSAQALAAQYDSRGRTFDQLSEPGPKG